MNPTLQPELSILLVADSTAEVMSTLRGYGEGIDKARLEVVIVSRYSQALSAEPVQSEGFTQLQMLSVEGDSFARAEARGVRAATAPYVVFGLPNGAPGPGYVDAIRAAQMSGDWSVIGPTLVNAGPLNALSWAVTWIFNGPWLHDPPRGAMSSVPGHHSAYRREALLALGDELDASLVAGEHLLVALRNRGHRFLLEPAAVVNVTTASRPGEFITCLFQNARLYAALRMRHWSMLRRFGYVAGSPLIPLVRIPRIFKHVRRAGQQRMALSRAPILLAGLAISAAGEMAGYLLGPGAPWRFERRTP
ncbi:MAG TPA: hypothetical protein VI566_07085 [Xanthomonadales bacterium]|nr:hypothetical protein [Xanthomonadales bacterium]